MLNINNTLIAGGFYKGGNTWNKKASSLDNCFKIYQIKEGEAFLEGKGCRTKLEENGIYLINGYNIDKQYCPDSFEVNWVHFSCDSVVLKPILQKLPLATRIKTDKLLLFNPVFDSFNEFFKKYRGKHETVNKEILSKYFEIQSLLIWLISHVVENSDPGIFSLSDSGGRLINAIEYINGNYKLKITLKLLADLCYMSENYFHAKFKKEFAVTPNTYILQLRMNEALSLLSNTGFSIKEIARECGYSDPAYFSRTFSKYFQISPKQVRKLDKPRIP